MGIPVFFHEDGDLRPLAPDVFCEEFLGEHGNEDGGLCRRRKNSGKKNNERKSCHQLFSHGTPPGTARTPFPILLPQV